VEAVVGVSVGSNLTGTSGRVGVGAMILRGATTVVGDRLGIGAVNGTSALSALVREIGDNESCCEAALCVASDGLDRVISVEGSSVPPSAESGSGRHSTLHLLHRGQTHSRDNDASRLRSLVGYSSAPTPTAAVPFKGKNP